MPLLQTRITAESGPRANQAALWAQRNAFTKEKEFAAAHELFEIAQQVLESFKDRDPSEISLTETGRALDLASKLTQLAGDMATEKTEQTVQTNNVLMVKFEAALKKVYGNNKEDEPIDVPVVDASALN